MGISVVLAPTNGGSAAASCVPSLLVLALWAAFAGAALTILQA